MKCIKWIILFSIIASVFMGAVFHRPLFSKLAAWTFHIYASSQWGRHFHYDQAYLDGSQLIVLKPRYKKGSSFCAERLVFSFATDWRKLQCSMGVSIDQPQCHLSHSLSAKLPDWEKLLGREDKWIKAHPDFHLEKGELSWSGSGEEKHAVQFDLKGNSREGGEIKVYFDSKGYEGNCMTLRALSTGGKMVVDCDCQLVDCASLMAFKDLIGLDALDWKISSGTLQGHLQACFAKGQHLLAEGELLVDRLQCCQLGGGLEGYLEQGRLTVNKRNASPVIAQIDILKPAFLRNFQQEDKKILDKIIGSLWLNDDDSLTMILDAEGEAETQWSLRGMANLNGLDLKLLCAPLNQPDGEVHFNIHQMQQSGKHAEIHLKRLNSRECTWLQMAMAPFFPLFNAFEIEEGILDGMLEADIMPQGIGKLQISHFKAHKLLATLHPWHARLSFSEASGKGSIDLHHEDIWSTLNVAMCLEEGTFQLADVQPLLPLTEIQGNLCIDQGHVEHSAITLRLAGLKGEMDFEWRDAKQFLTLKLDGMVQDAVELLPSAVQDGIRRQFMNDRLQVFANLKSKKQLLEIGGTIHVQRGKTDATDLIHFGCELKKTGKGAQTRLAPLGWFYAQGLPLDKFLSPFLFRNGKWAMSGLAELKGTFDDRRLAIKYDAENLKIENETACIEVKHLRSSIPGQLLGFHEVDLETYAHHGSLPISQGSYLLKAYDLQIQNIQGVASFENDRILLSPLEGFCEGIYFSGSFAIDYSNPAPGVFDLLIRFPTLSGRLSQMQRLMEHLNHSSILSSIPLEGEVAAKEEGLKMNFAFLPHDYQLSASFRGSISEGSLPFEDVDMALKGLYMDVDYDHANHLLKFSDIQGTLLVGKPRRIEEYLFIGSYLQLSGLPNPDLRLDCAIRDKDRELFRLVCSSMEEGRGVQSIAVDPQLSHLSGIHFNLPRCLIKNWSSLESFVFKSNFDFGLLVNDLQRFQNTGFLFLSPGCIAKLAKFSPWVGEASFDLSYHPAEKQFIYQMKGEKLKCGVGEENHFGLIQGRKQGKKWIIDHLQWDDWTLYAEFMQEAERWKIPCFGLKAGSSLLLGLEGEFNPAISALTAKLNVSEINLAEFGWWDKLRTFSRKWDLKGRLRAAGTFEWMLDADPVLDGLTASLQVQGIDLAIGDHYLTSSRSCWMKLACTKENTLSVQLEDGFYNFFGKEAALNNILCDISDDQLSFSAHSQYENCPFQINIKTTFPHCQEILCTLTDRAPHSQPLHLRWKQNPEHGIALRSIEGEFSGCTFNLSAVENLSASHGHLALQGEVAIDFNRLAPLLSAEAANNILKLKLGSNYVLNGCFWMHGPLKRTLLESVYFRGKCLSQHPILKGYQFERLGAEVHYIPGHLDIQQLTLEDSEGSARVENISLRIDPEVQRWKIFIPRLMIKNFRPFSLQDADSSVAQPSSKFRSLVAKRIEIQNFVGELQDTSTWQAQGNLHFLNPSRKNVSHPLLAIPAETVLRLGLDPQVLSPVTGIISFNVKGERIYFTRFKDVYSAGRGSKFYLADGPEPSWIDLDGNLSFHIRMKQYNLIFKIAELFTVSVQGNIKKPTYTLQKQAKGQPKGVN